MIDVIRCIHSDITATTPSVFIFNDKDLFDHNELRLIRRLFDPYSTIYHEISSSELMATLDPYDEPYSLEAVYIVPPLNEASVLLNSSLIETFKIKLNIFLAELSSPWRVAHNTDDLSYAPPLKLIGSITDNDLNQVILDSIDYKELCIIYDHPYDVVNALS